jgi:pimeloyl-ACP methyl ester carboxylesterase
MTPRIWTPFSEFYRARGYRVLAPPWPRFEREIESLRRYPDPMDDLGIAEIVDHYEHLIRGLDAPPILMGHSFGGLFVQILLDRGVGAAGVAIDSVSPKGVCRLPFSQLRALSPVLRNPANRRRAVSLTLDQFQYAFANTMSERDAREAFEANAVPAPGRIVFEAALANLNPHAPTRVHYRNHTRAPLLMIAGGDDHVVPPSINRANVTKYRDSRATTDFMEFPGRSHLIVAQTGWQEVADRALDWARTHAAAARPAGAVEA